VNSAIVNSAVAKSREKCCSPAHGTGFGNVEMLFWVNALLGGGKG
jgi:hypothetical protein